MSESFVATERSRVRRQPSRGSHDRAEVYAILDEALVCNVGLSLDGRPLVIPMGFGRRGDTLFLHGAVASRLLKVLGQGTEACVSVTLVDGLVFARSAFHSSLNYRSVVAFGRASRIEGEEDRRQALDVIVEHLLPGRLAELRSTTPQELAATEVVRFEIEEASAKARSGPPKDGPEDLAEAVWAGVVPLERTWGVPQPACDLRDGVTASTVVTGYRRPGVRA